MAGISQHLYQYGTSEKACQHFKKIKFQRHAVQISGLEDQ